MSRGAAESRVRPHRFGDDRATPADYYGQTYCRWCGLPGVDGDDRHPADAPSPLPDLPPDARALTARILGEPLDDDPEQT